MRESDEDRRIVYWMSYVCSSELAVEPGHTDYGPSRCEGWKSRGYDYWALGHVPEFEVVSTELHVIFPGNVQGRTIRETGAKGAVLVAVDDGEVASVERKIGRASCRERVCQYV